MVVDFFFLFFFLFFFWFIAIAIQWPVYSSRLARLFCVRLSQLFPVPF